MTWQCRALIRYRVLHLASFELHNVITKVVGQRSLKKFKYKRAVCRYLQVPRITPPSRQSCNVTTHLFVSCTVTSVHRILPQALCVVWETTRKLCSREIRYTAACSYCKPVYTQCFPQCVRPHRHGPGTFPVDTRAFPVRFVRCFLYFLLDFVMQDCSNATTRRSVATTLHH